MLRRCCWHGTSTDYFMKNNNNRIFVREPLAQLFQRNYARAEFDLGTKYNHKMFTATKFTSLWTSIMPSKKQMSIWIRMHSCICEHILWSLFFFEASGESADHIFVDHFVMLGDILVNYASISIHTLLVFIV